MMTPPSTIEGRLWINPEIIICPTMDVPSLNLGTCLLGDESHHVDDLATGYQAASDCDQDRQLAHHCDPNKTSTLKIESQLTPLSTAENQLWINPGIIIQTINDKISTSMAHHLIEQNDWHHSHAEDRNAEGSLVYNIEPLDLFDAKGLNSQSGNNDQSAKSSAIEQRLWINPGIILAPSDQLHTCGVSRLPNRDFWAQDSQQQTNPSPSSTRELANQPDSSIDAEELQSLRCFEEIRLWINPGIILEPVREDWHSQNVVQVSDAEQDLDCSSTKDSCEPLYSISNKGVLDYSDSDTTCLLPNCKDDQSHILTVEHSSQIYPNPFNQLKPQNFDSKDDLKVTKDSFEINVDLVTEELQNDHGKPQGASKADLRSETATPNLCNKSSEDQMVSDLKKAAHRMPPFIPSSTAISETNELTLLDTGTTESSTDVEEVNETHLPFTSSASLQHAPQPASPTFRIDYQSLQHASIKVCVLTLIAFGLRAFMYVFLTLANSFCAANPNQSRLTGD